MEGIRKILLGDKVAAARLIPQAQSHARMTQERRKEIGIDLLSSHVDLPNGYIKVKASLDYTEAEIYVEPQGGLFYEFTASDHVSASTFTDPHLETEGVPIEVDGVTYLVLWPSLTFVKLHMADIEFKYNPLYIANPPEDFFFPLQEPAKAPNTGKPAKIKKYDPRFSVTGLNDAPTYWATEPDDDGIQYIRGPLPGLARLQGTWNRQCMQPYVWYFNRGKMFVTSSNKLAPNMGNSHHVASSIMQNYPFVRNMQGSIDVGPDTDTLVFGKAYAKAIAVAKTDSLDYEMHHGVTVTVNGVSLFILTDVKGDFYVHKTSDSPDKIEYIKVTPPYPSWVSYDTFNGRWEWNFDSTGLRVVGCPYHSDSQAPKTEWQYMELDEVDASNPCWREFPHAPDSIDIEDPRWFTDPVFREYGHINYARRQQTGICEFKIEIQISDDGELQDVKMHLLQHDWFGASGTYYVAADYEHNTDALITQHIEVYTEKPLVNRPEFSNDYMDLRDSSGVFTWWDSSNPCALPDHSTEMDVIWTMKRDGVEIAREPLLVGLPLRRGHTEQHGLGHVEDQICGDDWIGRNYDISERLNYGTCLSHLYKNGQTITAVDMKSVSYTVLTLGYDHKTHRLYSNGHLLKEVSTGDESVEPAVPKGKVRTPYHEIYSYWRYLNMYHLHSSSIRSHPHGHLAVCAVDYYGSDAPCNAPWDHSALEERTIKLVTLDYIRLADGSETTHKELFNEAFKQDRDYTYYYEPIYDPERGNVFQAHDVGSFGVSGVWRLFK